jgi:hypothetical protein
MIYAFNFTCNRDADLAELMFSTFSKYVIDPYPTVVQINTDEHEDYKGYGNGSGWPQGLLKLKCLKTIVPRVGDDDFILSIDSDVVFTSSEVFKYIDSQYGIIGTQHRQPYQSRFGLFGHMSGAMIFLRGDIARKIAALSDEALDMIRHNHFKAHNITENEDVMLSYFAKYVGAESFDLGEIPGLTSGDFEADVYHDKVQRGRGRLKSFYHLNYCPKTFLDQEMGGAKWLIPKVLREKGIEL